MPWLLRQESKLDVKQDGTAEPSCCLKGMNTSELIREQALEMARQVIEEAERIEFDADSYRGILELLDNPPAPSDALRRAMRAHRAAGL